MNKLIDLGYDFLKWLFGFLRRPHLTIGFEQSSEPFIGQDVLNNDRIAAFYRLTVTNQGKTAAEECQGYLIAVEPIVGGHSANQLGKPEVLKWAHEQDFQTIRIEAGECRKLDLLYIYRDDPGQMYFFFKQPDSAVGVYPNLASAEYRVKVRVNHKNHSPAFGCFLIRIVGGEAIITENASI
jgi:hypothetical protein